MRDWPPDGTLIPSGSFHDGHALNAGFAMSECADVTNPKIHPSRREIKAISGNKAATGSRTHRAGPGRGRQDEASVAMNSHIGSRVRRLEDAPFLKGKGHYLDDIPNLPGLDACLFFVRSIARPCR